MNVQFEKTAPCQGRVSFTVTPEEFEAEVRRLLGDVGRHSRMKGFRPGKIPLAVVQRLHGREVRREAKERFVQRAYEQAVGENEIRPLEEPRVELSPDEVEPGQGFSHQFDLMLRPEFELGEYAGLAIEGYAAPISDQEVEAAIQQACGNQARPEPAGEEGLPEDGMALVSAELLHAGAVVFRREGLRVSPQTALPGVDPVQFKERLSGARAGQTIEVPVLFPPDFEVEAARGAEGTCRVAVKEAYRIVVPSRDELRAVLKLESDDALRARVREKLEQAAREQEDQRVETVLLDRLIDAHRIDLPEAMVEGQMRQRLDQARQALAAQGVDSSRAEQELSAQEPAVRASAVRGCTAFFLVERIAEKERLQVSSGELRAELRAIAERNRTGVDEVARYYQERQLLPQLGVEILERKVRRFLRENARISAPPV